MKSLAGTRRSTLLWFLFAAVIALEIAPVLRGQSLPPDTRLPGAPAPLSDPGRARAELDSVGTKTDISASIHYLARAMDQYHNRFPVYEDVSSAGNHFHMLAKFPDGNARVTINGSYGLD